MNALRTKTANLERDLKELKVIIYVHLLILFVAVQLRFELCVKCLFQKEKKKDLDHYRTAVRELREETMANHAQSRERVSYQFPIFWMFYIVIVCSVLCDVGHGTDWPQSFGLAIVCAAPGR